MVVATIASGLLALAVFRVIARYLPFRMRPMFNPDLHFNFPSGGLDPAVLPAWSSFPSDHAMLWISVAMGIFLVRRGVGVLALLYTAIVILLPRVYLRLALSDRHTRGGGDWGDHHLEHDSGPH